MLTAAYLLIAACGLNLSITLIVALLSILSSCRAPARPRLWP